MALCLADLDGGRGEPSVAGLDKSLRDPFVLPFSDVWAGLFSTSVIDIWIWAILLIAVLAPLLGKLVNSEIGAKGGSGSGWAVTGLFLLLLYDGGRFFLYSQAIALQEPHMYNGETPRRVLAYPTHMNPLVWEGIVETGALFATHEVNLAAPFDPAQSRIHYKPENSPAIETAAALPVFKRLTAFSRALLWSVTPATGGEGGTRVVASDLYFGFSATATLDSAGRVISSNFQFRRDR